MNNAFISFILYIFVGGIVANAAPLPKERPVRVFITAGQSNTDGRVNNKLLPSYIKALATDTAYYTEGKYPFGKISQNRTDGQFVPFWPKGRIKNGLWTYDAITYYLIGKTIKEDFYVVKWAVGGTSIGYPNDTIKGKYWSANEKWLSNTTSTQNGGKSLLLSFTQAIDAAIDQTLSQIKQGYHIDGFLWHQGESDSKFAGAYYKNLKELISYVRKHLTEKTGENYMNLPFIFGSIPKTYRHYREEVETAMHRIAEEDQNAYLIDMSEAGLQNDRTHFHEKSAEYLGEKMFKVLDKIHDLSNTGFKVARFKGNKNAAISYTFDDGLAEHYTLVAPHLEKLNLRGTFFINGSRVNKDAASITDSTRVSWPQLIEMSKKGHEISNHGWAHKNFSKFPLNEIKEDIDKNDSAIFVNTGLIPRTFCYPNNNQKADGVIIASANRVGTRKFQYSIGGKRTSEDLERWVNKLIQTKDWGVGMTHGITYGYDSFINSQCFWDHLEKVKSLEDSIWVGTFREVATYTKEQKAITFEIKEKKNGLIVIPKLSLCKTLFNELLTAVIEKDNIAEISVFQNGKKLKVERLSHNILFEFDPFGGEIDIEILETK